METYKQHHYIPKFLLKQWHSGEDNKLSHMHWIHSRMAEKRYKAKSVAKERHLYSMDRPSFQPNAEIEPKFMNQFVDTPASIVHKAILKTGPIDISREQRYAWTLFLVSLLYRLPGAIAHVRECGIDAISSQFPRDVEKTGVLNEQQIKLREMYLRRDQSLLDFGTYALPQLIQTSSYNKNFFEASWDIRRITKVEERLLIGDRPLTQLGPQTNLDLIYLPLAPDIAFFIYRSSRMRTWIDSMPEGRLIKELNRRMVEQASIYVWGVNFEHRKLLELRLQKRPAGRGIGIGARPKCNDNSPYMQPK